MKGFIQLAMPGHVILRLQGGIVWFVPIFCVFAEM